MTEVMITTDGERTSSMDNVEQCSGSMNQAMAGQTIFLTGAAGFTDADLPRLALRETSHRVVIFDAVSSSGNLERHAGPDAQPSDRHAFVRGRLCDRRVRRAAIATQDPDAVMDMSLEGRVDRSIVDGTTGRTPGASARPRALEKTVAWYRGNESRRWLVKSVAHLESCEQQHGGR